MDTGAIGCLFTHGVLDLLQKPYFGGFKSCEDLADDADGGGFEPGDLICGACVPSQNKLCCIVHGTEFMCAPPLCSLSSGKGRVGF